MSENTVHFWLNRRAMGVVAAALAGAALVGGTGAAAAVDPTTARTSAGCYFANDAERAQNIQTCTVPSAAMGSTVTVKVRPSTQSAGQQEQAVYLLGGITSTSDTLASGYGDKYNLVMVEGSSNAWTSDWVAPPRDSNGNTLVNQTGGTYNPRWETFIGTELPKYLNENFDIDETDNAIVGLSENGGQAVNIALKYPTLFKVALSVSGYYQTDNPLGYFLVPYALKTRTGVSNALRTCGAVLSRPGTPGPRTMSPTGSDCRKTTGRPSSSRRATASSPRRRSSTSCSPTAGSKRSSLVLPWSSSRMSPHICSSSSQRSWVRPCRGSTTTAPIRG